MLHVGGSPLHSLKAWSNNGRGKVKDFFGGEKRPNEGRRTHAQTPESFVSVMVLDGVFERHPNLRGAAIERLGHSWVPEMLRRLDWVPRIYGRVDERPLRTQALRAAHGADGLHALPPRRRSRTDRRLEQPTLPLLRRLPARRRRAGFLGKFERSVATTSLEFTEPDSSARTSFASDRKPGSETGQGHPG